MLKKVHEGNSGKVTTFGKSKLHCSSGIFDSSWIILVEGRADILNLLRAGYDNALGIEGAKIDESIKELCDKKDKVVAFLDGDRAGGFILKELRSVVNIDVELRADEGIEVEELTPKRIDEILRPVAETMNQEVSKPKSLTEDDTKLADLTQKIYPKINESLESIGLNNNGEEVFQFPISELVEKLSSQSDITYLVLDGIITQRLLDAAKQIGIRSIIGHKIAKLENTSDLTLKTFTDLNVN